jgi:hypothetical protein
MVAEAFGAGREREDAQQVGVKLCRLGRRHFRSLCWGSTYG